MIWMMIIISCFIDKIAINRCVKLNFLIFYNNNLQLNFFDSFILKLIKDFFLDKNKNIKHL